jgi:spore cortex formation protein SpoVR/YcgB (stage V sporulation)
MREPLFTSSEWTFPLLHSVWDRIEEIAKSKYDIDYYPVQIEVITSEEMIDAYCVSSEHTVLTTDLRWVKLKTIKAGDRILGFDEECKSNSYRQYREATVESIRFEEHETYEVEFESGTKFITTNDHLWLIKRDGVRQGHQQHWVRTDELTRDHYSCKLMETWDQVENYETGWLAGMYDGEGCVILPRPRVHCAQNPGKTLDKLIRLSNKYHSQGININEKHGSDCVQISLAGNMSDRLEFLGTIRPQRLLDKVTFNQLGTMYTTRYEKDYIKSIKPVGKKEVAVMKTSTGTFVCDGHPMHNCSHAMPVMYDHWSFGKQAALLKRDYKKGIANLAYEVVINTNPCIAYLMQNNTMTMQTLVLAHAAVGHNAFFKSNYLFKEHTNASSILDYLRFAKNYIEECEKAHGLGPVEELLDMCHSLQYQSIDRYQRRNVSDAKKKEMELARLKNKEEMYDPVLETIKKKKKRPDKRKKKNTTAELPEDNLLYFVEKNSIVLEPWQKEIVRIVRYISQYFYPQILTKVGNEGFASFWHYTIMSDLCDEGSLTEGHRLEFLTSHTNVLTQMPYNSTRYSGINPYALGFAIYSDIRRICENPTPEDREYMPELIGQNWIDAVKDAAAGYKDSSFVANFLSPKVVRDLRLFSVISDPEEEHYTVTHTHNKSDFYEFRRLFSKCYDWDEHFPTLKIVNYTTGPDAKITLIYDKFLGRDLADSDNTKQCLQNLSKLMGVPVNAILNSSVTKAAPSLIT